MKKRKITEKEIEVLKHFTRRRKVSHWGSDSMVKPILVNTVFGNGRKLMWFQTLINRPLFYLVLVDSKTPLEGSSNDDIYNFFEKHNYIYPDAIYEAIEEEYGNCQDMNNGSYGEKGETPCRTFNKSKDEYPCSGCRRYLCCQWTKWPALNEDCGCGWGEEAIFKNGKWKQ